MKILIYGFGRMGLTHFAILNTILNNKCEFIIVEPNKKLGFFLEKNLNVKLFKSDESFSDPFDLTLITTPPFIHEKILTSSLARGDKKIFVEKPFGGYTNNKLNLEIKNSNVYIGYVLRFNPCIQWIKNKISIDKIKRIESEYLSNTLEKKPKGWRNGPFSGVLNEMGSHIIDLIQYIIEDGNLTVIDSSKKSIISDVDDIVDAKLVSSKKINIDLHLNWVSKNTRKPVFKMKIWLNDMSYYLIDQQIIRYFNKKNELIKQVSVVDIAEKVPFYLRGVDFTKQMLDLVNSCDILSNSYEAVKVNKTLKKIIENEGITRR